MQGEAQLKGARRKATQAVLSAMKRMDQTSTGSNGALDRRGYKVKKLHYAFMTLAPKQMS